MLQHANRQTFAMIYLTPLIALSILLSRFALFAASSATDAGVLIFEEPKLLTGAIYAKNSNRKTPLFKFQRVATRNGSNLIVTREYLSPDGKPAVRERIEYQGNDLVSFRLEELQINAKGSAHLQRMSRKPTVMFEYTPPKGRTGTETETLQKETLIDDMIGPFLTANRAQLLNGGKVKCRYIVVPRKETVGFTFVKESESTRNGKPVLVVKMEPTSPIIAALVDPIFFTLEKESPHRILEYVGRTSPKLRDENKWKDLDAVTVFDW
jgi:hypothetical protein